MPWKPNTVGPVMVTGPDRQQALKCKCGGFCIIRTGREMYPNRSDLWKKRFYVCQDCGSYVGAHPNGTPYGTPANERTRKARMKAHEFFDYLWKSGKMTRTAAYKRLERETGVKHISWEDHRGCEVVVDWARGLRFDLE